MRRVQSIEERFWAKVRAMPDGCWEWAASRSPGGYGRFWLRDRMETAHRLTYLWLVGPVVAGHELDHLCRDRACVNPTHLEAVTHRENVLRGSGPSAVHARRTFCPRGHPYSGSNLRVLQGRRDCRECVKNWQTERTLARHTGVCARCGCASDKRAILCRSCYVIRGGGSPEIKEAEHD